MVEQEDMNQDDVQRKRKTIGHGRWEHGSGPVFPAPSGHKHVTSKLRFSKLIIAVIEN